MQNQFKSQPEISRSFNRRKHRIKPDPFNYVQMSYEIGYVFAFVLMIIYVFLVSPSWWAWIVWFAVSFLFQKFVAKILWAYLSESFRANIPYDSADAFAGKGTIKSYTDLFKWITKKN